MILGYGTSHDAGIAVLDAATGEPLFAAGLERLNRKKSASGNPLEILAWANAHLGEALHPYQPLPLNDELAFSASRGFHELEHAAAPAGFPYRWTAERATLEIPVELHCMSADIYVSPESTVKRLTAAEVYVNGQQVLTTDNRKPAWKVHSTDDSPIGTIEIRVSAPFSMPPDGRQLGVMLTGVGLHFARADASGGKGTRNRYAGDHLPVAPSVARLYRKQFLDLPRLGLRGHTSKKLLSHTAQYLEAVRAGCGSVAQRFVHPVRLDQSYDHHLCHAASAYYPSGFERALVVTLDGLGDWLSARVMLGEDGRLVSIDASYYEQMPTGLHYEIITALLGFNPLRHAGKVTGLAAYGEANAACAAAFDAFFNEMWSRRGRANRNYEYFRRTREEVGLAALRELRQSEFGDFSREDIAYYIQKRTEDEVREFVRGYQVRFPELENICLAGGVFANVRVNQEVHRLGFKQVFVQPAMSDAGLCYGAALLECAKQNGGKLTPYTLRDVYLGPGYTNEFIAEEIERHGLTAEFIEESRIGRSIAEEIAAKRVVAHFHGRMEFGPRALGNRSILYSAADPDVNRWLNDQLQRTEFMPFAPAVMAEHAAEFFKDIAGAEHSAEFMTITFDCTERAKREIPAAVHVDGTARPQIVRADRNPRFLAILTAFHDLTGTPVVINPSFSMHEEPIVASPADAIRSFQQGNLDLLVLGNWLVRRQG
jgi:carbamoyltransferase